MPHNPRSLGPGSIPGHFVLTPGRLEALDQYASESLDGVAGGAYAPSSPIAIGGAGLDLRGASSKIRGDVSTGRNAVGITLAAGTRPTFNGTARTRSFTVPIRLLSEFDNFSLRTAEQIFDPYGVRSLRTDGGSWYCALSPLRLHHGATLVSARLRWRSGRMPSALTAAALMPMARIIRIKRSGLQPTDYDPVNVAEVWKVPARANATAYALGDVVHSTGGGNWDGSNGRTYRCVVAGSTAAVQPAMSTTVGANQVDGSVTWRVEHGWNNRFLHYQFPPLPASLDVAAYHNDGLPQDLPLRVNINTTIDTETYEYRLEIREPGGEGGVGFGNVYHSLEVTVGNILSLREP